MTTIQTIEQQKTSRGRSSSPSQREILNRYIDGATDVLSRTIVAFQRDGDRERQFRDAQFAVRMAELGSKIQSVEELERRLADRLTTIKDGRDGTDGKSVAIDDVRPVVKEYVESVLAGWDRPKDGASVTVDDVEPVLRDMVDAAFARIPVPRDGKDGRDGIDGVSVDPDAVKRMIADEVALIPPAPAGKDADPEIIAAVIAEKVRDAVDALPPPEKGEKGDKGDVGPAGSLPLVEDWQDRVYYEGQVCSFGGAVYQARKDTGKEPGHSDWRCIVHRGLDGADGKKGDQGPQGKQGKAGPRGDRGAGAVQSRLSDDGQHMITKFSDGTEVVCDLYPVFSRIA